MDTQFFRDFSYPSPVDSLLTKPNLELEELLEEDEVVSEARKQKQKLLDFLTLKPNLEKLVYYLTEPEISEPSDQNVKKYLRYGAVACEIFSSRVDVIDDALVQTRSALDQLFKFFEKKELHFFYANIVFRVLSVLTSSRPTQMSEYIQSQPNFIDNLILHLDSAPIYDFLSKIILDTEDLQQWLVEQKFVPRIIALFDPKNSTEVQENACVALKEIIMICGIEFPLLQVFHEEEILSSLIEQVLSDQVTLIHGTNVLLSLLGKLLESEEIDGVVHDPPTWISTLLKYLPRFKQLLLSEQDATLLLASRETALTFGFHRLKVLELFYTILCTGFSNVQETMLEHQIFDISIDLFLKYEWNNFVHHIVERIFIHVFRETSHDFCLTILQKTKLLSSLLTAEARNREIESKPGGVRRSYMGHLLNIFIEIKALTLQYREIKILLEKEPLWIDFQKNILTPREKIDTKPLGGLIPERAYYENTLSSSTDGFGQNNSDSNYSDQNDDNDNNIYEDEEDLENEPDVVDSEFNSIAEVMIPKEEIESYYD